MIFDAIEKYAKSWAKHEHSSVSVLDDWVSCIKDVVNKRIEKYKHHQLGISPVLSNNDIKEYLHSVHSRFVLAPADKASNNVIIICKKFYFDMLAKELGVTPSGVSVGNNTYKKCTSSETDIVKEHLSFLSKYNIIPDTTDSNLPGLYWLPKLHKDHFALLLLQASALLNLLSRKCSN